MNLTELLLQVKESALTKPDLEELYTHFENLHSQVELRMGELEKAEALFKDTRREESVAAGSRIWKATPDGQELITLNRQNNVIKSQLAHIKHRIYSTY